MCMTDAQLNCLIKRGKLALLYVNDFKDSPNFEMSFSIIGYVLSLAKDWIA
jgi:hypothetical protein